MILHLHSTLVRLHLEYSDRFWASQYMKRYEFSGESLAMATEVIMGLEHLLYEESLRQLGLINLEKRRLGGIPSICLNT